MAPPTLLETQPLHQPEAPCVAGNLLRVPRMDKFPSLSGLIATARLAYCHFRQPSDDVSLSLKIANQPEDAREAGVLILVAFSSKAFSTTKAGSRRGAARSRSRATTSVIVGGGGHGLATAYYLAKEHGITNVAVLEKGWLGGGNTGRNTTIVRSNYLCDESAHLYEHVAQAVGGLVAGAQLQRDVQPARRAEPRAHAARHARASKRRGATPSA